MQQYVFNYFDYVCKPMPKRTNEIVIDRGKAQINGKGKNEKKT